MVVHTLAQAGHEVWLAPRGDLRVSVNVSEDADACVHLAAYCGGIGKNQDNPSRMLNDNMRMSLNITRFCADHDIHLVALGSVCAYPEHTPVPFVEDYLWKGYPEPTNAPYGLAKRMLLEMCRAFGCRYTYLLPANMYGPGDNFNLHTSHVVPAMIRKFIDARGIAEPVRLWGDGSPTRDLLYVADAARAIAKAVEVGPLPQPINLGTGVETSMRKLAHIIGAETLHCGPVTWDKNKPNGQQRRCLDTTRADLLLGWTATTPLREGIRKTILWYRDQSR